MENREDPIYDGLKTREPAEWQGISMKESTAEGALKAFKIIVEKFNPFQSTLQQQKELILDFLPEYFDRIICPSIYEHTHAYRINGEIMMAWHMEGLQICQWAEDKLTPKQLDHYCSRLCGKEMDIESAVKATWETKLEALSFVLAGGYEK